MYGLKMIRCDYLYGSGNVENIFIWTDAKFCRFFQVLRWLDSHITRLPIEGTKNKKVEIVKLNIL